jgi:hypothetical protein
MKTVQKISREMVQKKGAPPAGQKLTLELDPRWGQVPSEGELERPLLEKPGAGVLQTLTSRLLPHSERRVYLGCAVQGVRRD